ncbi:Hypothetical_protein [Hexamita inflata]|uniref:Hypothetical_protein n=1 Tax=Hexamita inflata TaxID=28002 RepID=A0AA86QZ18_9EUKA|nr:Hypothetical protein HINF_LOCUS56374 [Hexamita inflata]
MSSIINEKHLMGAIQRLLTPTNSDIYYIIQVMILPDAMYNLLFCQLSFDLNLKLETIHSLFSELSTKYLYINQLSLSKSLYTLQRISVIETKSQTESQSQNDSQIITESQSQNQKVTERQNKTYKKEQGDKIPLALQSQQQNQNNSKVLQKRKSNKQSSDKIPLSQFKQQFSETLKTIIGEFDDSVNEMTDKQMSQVLIDYFQKNDQRVFWERVQSLITYKTKIQLKEYFQKSFLRCQYEQQISEDDKQKIVELTRAMPQSKPSEIVNAFFNKIGDDCMYFRRKVIMFVYYLKRAVR